MPRFLLPCTIWVSLFLLLITATLPTNSALHAQPDPDQRCFTETEFCIHGRLREFWEQHGGLPVFGLPIGPQEEHMIEGSAVSMQWFERTRLELHPQNPPPYDVLLGRLGADVLERQNRDWHAFPKDQPDPACRFFEETGFNVCGDILEAWQASGLELDGEPGKTSAESLALFGLPISPPQTETLEGREYTVQWFERTRFELHPDHTPPYHVLLGLLGNELLLMDEPPPPAEEPPVDEPPVDEPPVDEPPPAEEPPIIDRPQTSLGEQHIVFETSRDDNWEIYLMVLNDLEPIRFENLTNDPSHDRQPAWSPDGTKIAFTSERDGNKNIFTMNADGTGLVRLTEDLAADEEAAWSPDATKIAFSSDRTGTRHVYLMDADGTNVVNLTEDAPGSYREPAWSPDGSKIALVGLYQNDRDIYTMNTDGSNLTNITRKAGHDEHPAWSPDGTRIAFSSYREGKKNIFVMDANGDNQSRRTNTDENDEYPVWSPDSEYIIFSSDRKDKNYELYLMRPDGSDVTRLTVWARSDTYPSWRFGSQ